MFGLGKKDKGGKKPVEFSAEVEISRPAADVYSLINIADKGYAQRRLGNTVKQVEGSADHFTLHLDELPEVAFHFRQIESNSPELYTLECTPEPQIGNLVKAIEANTITPRGDNACRVEQTVKATFSEGLNEDELAMEIAMMSASLEGDLEKLKIHAEQGTEAVKALEAEQFG